MSRRANDYSKMRHYYTTGSRIDQDAIKMVVEMMHEIDSCALQNRCEDGPVFPESTRPGRACLAPPARAVVLGLKVNVISIPVPSELAWAEAVLRRGGGRTGGLWRHFVVNSRNDSLAFLDRIKTVDPC
jgi:hypothetical protein